MKHGRLFVCLIVRLIADSPHRDEARREKPLQLALHRAAAASGALEDLVREERALGLTEEDAEHTLPRAGE